jgi:hypothetical protein
MTTGRVSRLFVYLLVACQFSLPCPADAQRSTPGPAGYAQAGERTVTIQPDLRLHNHKYQVHYFTTGAFNTNDLKFFFVASPQFFDQKKITAILVTEDGRIVEDEETQRTVLQFYRACYYL